MGGRYYLHPYRWAWLYLATVKVLCTKKVVGYAFSSRIDTQLTLAALDMAVRRENRVMVLFPTPTVASNTPLLPIGSACPSSVSVMSRKGDPYDNAVAENFFSCLKCELIHLHRFDTRAAAQNAVFAYIESFYNNLRPHSAIAWLPPNLFAKRFAHTTAA